MKTNILTIASQRAARAVLMVCLPLLSLTSCGLIDFELNEEETVEARAIQLVLDRDSAYVMVGDTFDLHAQLSPATLVNNAVFWQTDHDSVAATTGMGTVTARTPGETWVKAISVEGQQVDSCYVRVLSQWALTPPSFSADMVVYARVTIGGLDFDPATTRLAAVCGNEVRALGELCQWQGHSYVCFRIYSHLDLEGSADPTDIIRFCYYDRSRLHFAYFDTFFRFDGESHGSLSSPVLLAAP